MSLDSVSVEERRNAIDLLAQCNFPYRDRVLFSAMKDHPLNDVRSGIASELGKMGGIGAVPELMDTLKDASSLVRGSATWALGKIGDSASVPRLIEALGDSDNLVRANAAEALGKIGSKEAVTGLIESLGDRDNLVRSKAALSLGKIGDKMAVPGLIVALKDTDSLVRVSVVEALGAIISLEKCSSPRVAFVGMTYSGKSNLINALWRSQVAKSDIKSNLTDQIIAYKFPGELVVYNTPGVLNEIGFENVTRLFLGLKPIEPQPKMMISFRYCGESDIFLDPENVREEAPIDIVLWVADFSVPSYAHRGVNFIIKEFYQELKEAYSGKLIVVGTHLDKVEGTNRERLKTGWNEFLGSDLIPVSSATNEGIKDLVFKIFSTMPCSVSLAKLQKSLEYQKKIERQPFVILETSQILAKTVLLTGKDTATIKFLIAELFTIIYWHYSVEEVTWKSTNGDLLNIIKSLQEKSVKKDSRLRDPIGLFEKFLSYLGGGFSDEFERYDQLGADGLIELIIAVHNTISNFDGQKYAKKEEEIRSYIAERRDLLAHLIIKNSKEEISKEIRQILMNLLSEKGKII
jgi:GTP-binding protein EngB required for normal cell division